MAIAQRGSTTVGTASNCGTATATANKPTGVVDGDVLCLIVTAHNACCGSDTVSVSTPSGWTVQDAAVFGVSSANGVFTKVASGEGSTQSVSATGTGGAFNTTQISMEYFALSGVDTTTPVEVKGAQNNASSTNATAPSVTTSTANDFVVATAHFVGSATFTAAAGYTSLGLEFANGVSVAASQQTIAAIGATGTIVNTLGSAKVSRCVTLAFKPVSVGIAFDIAANSGDQAAASSYSGSASWNGANRLLAVDVSMLGPGVTVTSMTYGGANCTFVGAQSTVTSFGRIEQWRIISSDSGAPGTGANTLSVTLSGSLEFSVEWVSYTGVHQNTPTEAFNSAQATNVGAADATVNITTVADNCWVHGAVVASDTSITANQTSRNNISGTLGSGANEDNNTAKTPAGSVTMSYTGVAALATWAIAGYAIRPVAASSINTIIAAQYANINSFTRFGIRVG